MLRKINKNKKSMSLFAKKTITTHSNNDNDIQLTNSIQKTHTGAKPINTTSVNNVSNVNTVYNVAGASQLPQVKTIPNSNVQTVISQQHAKTSETNVRTNYISDDSPLLSFYKKLLDMLDMEIADDFNIYKLYGHKKLPYVLNVKIEKEEIKLPVKFPNNKTIKTLAEVKDGDVIINHILYHPLDESPLHDNKIIINNKTRIESLVARTISALIQIIINKLTNKTDGLNTELIKLGAEIDKYKQPRMKSVIDDLTLDKITKVEEYIANLYPQHRYVAIVKINKRKEKEGDKYTAMARIKFPFIEELSKWKSKDKLFLGVQFRNKDKVLLETLFKHIFNMSLEELKNGITLGTTSSDFPFNALILKAYDWLYKKLKEAMDRYGIKKEDSILLNLKEPFYNSETLDKELDNYRTEANKIPYYKDVLNSLATSKIINNSQLTY